MLAGLVMESIGRSPVGVRHRGFTNPMNYLQGQHSKESLISSRASAYTEILSITTYRQRCQLKRIPVKRSKYHPNLDNRAQQGHGLCQGRCLPRVQRQIPTFEEIPTANTGKLCLLVRKVVVTCQFLPLMAFLGVFTRLLCVNNHLYAFVPDVLQHV